MHHMDKYIDFVFDHNSDMPECKKDIIRISELHSWYKHLGKFEKAYPLLMQGEEPRYPFDLQFTDENQNNFHWTIIMDYNIDEYIIKVCDTEKLQPIPQTIKNFMKRFPIYLDYDFNSCDNDKSNFLRWCCEQMCTEYWENLVELKKYKCYMGNDNNGNNENHMLN